jgi:hypothetical protein
MPAITVRLSSDDHKLLQLYCVATGKSQNAVVTELLRAELDRAMPGKRALLGQPQDPGAVWRAIGVEPPAADAQADAWSREVIDSLRDERGVGQDAA